MRKEKRGGKKEENLSTRHRVMEGGEPCNCGRKFPL